MKRTVVMAWAALVAAFFVSGAWAQGSVVIDGSGDPNGSHGCTTLHQLYKDGDTNEVYQATTLGDPSTCEWTKIGDTVPIEFQDADGDARYEVAGVWDADGDGSGYVTCTAKDTPDPACKIAGEVIYPDTVDDINCMIPRMFGANIGESRPGCVGGPMDMGGTIKLRDGVVYAMRPCWQPGGVHSYASPYDVTQRNDGSSDTTVLGYCAQDADGARLISMTLSGWKGTIRGGGHDLRDNQTSNMGPGTARPTGRTVGTTLAIDTGNYRDSWLGDGGTVGNTAQTPAMTIGMQQPPNTSTWVDTGTPAASAGDGKGWGSLTEDSDPIATAVSNGSVCVCDDATDGNCVGGGQDASATDWIDGLSAGDRMILILPIDASTTRPIGLQLRFLSASQPGRCTNANSQEVTFGFTGETVGPALAEIVDDDDGTGTAYLFAPDPAYFEPQVKLESVTIEPQDFWDESGGDCSDSGKWQFTTNEDENSADDPDCDTNPMLIHYSGQFDTRDVAWKHWHSFGIDGGSGIGRAIFNHDYWYYGHGEEIMDGGHKWTLRDLEIGYTSFNSGGGVMGFFGGYTTIENLYIHNFSAGFIGSIGNTIGHVWKDIELEGADIGSVLTISCGARRNRFEQFRVGGFYVSSTANAAIRNICTDSTNPSYFNTYSDWIIEKPGNTFGSDVDGGPHVVFWSGTNVEDGHFGDLYTGLRSMGGDSDSDACLFAIQQNNLGARDAWANSVFIGNMVRNGLGFCACSSTTCRPNNVQPAAALSMGTIETPDGANTSPDENDIFHQLRSSGRASVFTVVAATSDATTGTTFDRCTGAATPEAECIGTDLATFTSTGDAVCAAIGRTCSTVHNGDGSTTPAGVTANSCSDTVTDGNYFEAVCQ